MAAREHPTVPKRPLLLRLLTLAVALIGGANVGILLAERLAPDSEFAVIASFVLLPAVLVVGFHTWLGVAVILMLPRLFGRLRGEETTGPPSNAQVVPPGAWTFLPVGSLFGLVGGVVIGLLLASGSAIIATLSYCGIGTAYGTALWFLVRTGYQPFPEED